MKTRLKGKFQIRSPEIAKMSQARIFALSLQGNVILSDPPNESEVSSNEETMVV